MMGTNSQDIFFMKEALQLAKKGEGWVLPNPMVGAVVVKNGKVLGRGWHRKVGGPHAEIEAFRNAHGSLKGTTLYVTLAPCSHYGRTPPCTDAIIAAGVKRVVCAVRDPNQNVSRHGIEQLRKAGIRVDVGVLEKEAEQLNEQYITFHTKGRPFVALKFAASLDGAIATRTGDSKWITSREARAYARSLRGRYQAILVGKRTVMRDDPHLGVRKKGGSDPLRIVLDRTLACPLSRNIFRDSHVFVLTTKRASKKKLRQFQQKGMSVAVLPTLTIPHVLQALSRREIVSVFVEGGGEVLGSFVDAKAVDRVYAFHAPILVGGENAVRAVLGKGARTIKEALRLKHVTYKRFGDTMVTEGRV